MVSSVLFNAEATNRKWGRAALTIRKYKDSLCKTRHLGIYNDDFKGKNANRHRCQVLIGIGVRS